MSKRYYHTSQRVYVDVEVDLGEIDTDDLLAELRSRDLNDPRVPQRDVLIELREALLQGRTADALSTLERLIWPKWRTIDECASALAQANLRLSSA